MKHFSFSSENIHSIASILGVEAQTTGDEASFSLTSVATQQSLQLTLHNNVELGDEQTGTLVEAQTTFGRFELHDCHHFLVFEPDEVIFVSDNGDTISGIIVGKESTCSMFSNVRKSNLSADFAELDPRLLMSSMQLSLTEQLLAE